MARVFEGLILVTVIWETANISSENRDGHNAWF